MLDRNWIAARIPHQGSMCLLDGVLEWSPERVRCTSATHRRIDNPLRGERGLASICAVEYAAQAMAIHGALVAADDEPLRQGYLASMRGVGLHVARLDDIAEDLEVEAVRLSGDDNNILYGFEVRAGDRLLVDGRAAVILDAEGASRS